MAESRDARKVKRLTAVRVRLLTIEARTLHVVNAEGVNRLIRLPHLPHSPPLRRLGHILSIVLITAGIVVIADVGITLAYKEPLSSIYGSIKQGEAVRQLEDLEETYAAKPELKQAVAAVESHKADERKAAERTKIAALARAFEDEVSDGEAIGRIEAADMDGLNMAVVQGTDTASLEKGPGHYPETPMPGDGGTVGIAGHRTTYLAPFRHIDSMEVGDPITVKMPYAVFTYRVQKTEVVEPTDIGIVKAVGYPRLVLSACHPLYSASHRYVVFARLVHERLRGKK
jgi:sortase A